MKNLKRRTIVSIAFLLVLVFFSVAFAETEEEETIVSPTRLQYQNFVSEKTRENIQRQRSGLQAESLPSYEEWLTEQTLEKENLQEYKRIENKQDLKSKKKVIIQQEDGLLAN
jgi:Zn-dependent metalloprotease